MMSFQAHSLSVPRSLLRTLAALPTVVRNYASAIPETAWDGRRNAEAWTLREHLYHIAGVQEMLLDRIRLIRDSDHPVIQPFFPEQQRSTEDLFPSINKALEYHRTLRTEQIKILKRCRSRDWVKQAVHAEYSQYSLPVIAHHMVFHEYWHLYRMEEIWLTRDEYFH